MTTYIIAIGIGILVGILIWWGVRSAHNTIRFNNGASEYVVAGSMKFRRKHETYLYKKTNKREKPKEKG